MAFTGYANGGFDTVSAGLSSLGNAFQNYQKQQKLDDLGRQLQAGDYAGAAQSAIQAGDTQTALKLITLGNAGKPDPQFNSLIGVGGGAAQPAPPAAASVPGNNTYTGGLLPAQTAAGMDPNNMDPASPIIGSMENAGKGYAAVGPVTDNGDRAYGIHQVMGSNVGPWTKQVLGKEMTPQEFLSNPFAQERVFAQKFNEYRLKYGGDSAKAAQAWFAGPGGVGTDRSDGNMTVPEYSAEFASRNQTAPQVVSSPAEVASADNSFVPQTGSKPVASDSGETDAQEASLRGQQKMLAAGIAHYTSTGDAGKVKALELQYASVGKQIADLKDNYSIHTLGDGSMIAIARSDPSKVIPINTGAPPKNVAEYNARGQIADQLELKGEERKQYLLNGKIPDATRVLKPGDILTGPQGQTLGQNSSRAASMDDQTANFLAERVLAGDAKALIGIGRGAQGAENLGKIQGLAAQKAAERGIDASDMLHNVAVAQGMGAQERTLGTQTARMSSASTEAKGALDLLRQASDNVSRTDFIPLTRAIQLYQRNTNDPELAQLNGAMLTAANTYARAINPNGVPHAADKEHFYQAVNSAMNKKALNAVLDQFDREIELAHQAPGKASKMLNDIRQQGKTQQTGGVVPPSEGATATNPQTGEKVQLRGGQWVPLQ